MITSYDVLLGDFLLGVVLGQSAPADSERRLPPPAGRRAGSRGNLVLVLVFC